MKYVLIGGSVATMGAILGIRSEDKEGEITLFCGEKRKLYSRPLISYYLEGKTKEENLLFKGEDFYCKNKVDAIPYKVTSIDIENKTVTAEDGKTYPYDKLFFGAGSYPFVPPIAGLDKVKNKTCFYTLDDAEALKKMLTPTSRVLIVGAGLIGLKCAEGVYTVTKDITIADIQTRVLPNATTEEVGAILEKRLAEKGIKVILGAGVASFEEKEAILTDGKKVPFDVVVLAIGVRPTVEPLKSAGAAVNRGILVDEYLRTNIADVYCAGDCAEGLDATTGQKRLLQLFPSAYKGGYTAGRNMAGKNEAFLTDVPLNSTSLFDLKFTSCGIYEGEKIETKGEKYKALYIKDGRLVGYIMVGDTARSGIYTKIISERIPLSELGNVGTPTLSAFGEARRTFLTEEV